MPIVKGWGSKTFTLPWEKDQVSFLYDSKPGPEYFMFPMTGLLPVNLVSQEDLADTPHPLWISYIEPGAPVGKIDLKGDKTYRIDPLMDSFDTYIDALPYDSRKEMRYVLRKNQDLVVEENRKDDLLTMCEAHFDQINERAVSEGEKPFSEQAILALKEIFKEECVHTLSFREAITDASPIAVNVSFRRKTTVYDSFCIRSQNESVKKRSLGTFAILQNIRCAIRDGYTVYDMLAGDWGYKTKFGARAVPLQVYIKCTKEFAEHYEIPLEDISELVA